MKKHLFLIASVFATVSLQAQAIVNVVTDTGVKIKERTLFYVDGQIKVANYSNGSNKKVFNNGNVKITKNLVNENVDAQGQKDGSNFVNGFDPATKGYGQLIVKAGEENNGKITSQVNASTGFNMLPLAIPYKDITAGDVVMDLFGSKAKAFPGFTKPDKTFDPNRYKNALFFWDNNNYMFTHLGEQDRLGDGATAARYYAVNTKYAGNGEYTFNVKNIKGTPVKNNVPVIIKKTDLKGVKNTAPNKYGEAYGSYIYDFARKMPDGWKNYYVPENQGVTIKTDFGSRVYNFGNPYTSNIDLSKGGFPWDKIEALVQYGSQKYTDAINKGKASGAYGKEGATSSYYAVTSQNAGDTFLGVVAPFGTFAVKMKGDMGDTETFTFNDDMKTFNGMESRTGGNLVKTMFARANSNMPVINQVGLDLYDMDNNFTGARTYVVASDIYEASQKGTGTEIYNPEMTNEDAGIFSLQEKEDGSIDEDLAEAKTYINGINANKYIGKPIHLVMQNLKGQYTLKARLNDNLVNNKNKFYFEDKVTGKVEKVDKNFTYTFDVDGTEKDRFVLYWAATPKSERVEDVSKQQVNTTVVFKDIDTYKVRFDKEIKKADVFIYSISGQLVNAVKNIDASIDYIVPLKGNSSVYIVKIVGDNGQVTMKKIIK